ncbi:TetR/AcrR family transcriptional regulator [Streptomonospora sediminis]
MSERKPRADAARNREAVLGAADELFATCDRPEDVSMADIAAAAGVGKGTLFRGFGDRTGLIMELYQARSAPLRQALEDGPAPLGPATPPAERVPAVLDAVLCFKLDYRHLTLALEGAGLGSPYSAGHYEGWHSVLRGMLDGIPGFSGAGFAAHALLAAVRADLLDHLVGAGHSREHLRAELAAYTAKVLAGAGTGTGTAPAAGGGTGR